MSKSVAIGVMAQHMFSVELMFPHVKVVTYVDWPRKCQNMLQHYIVLHISASGEPQAIG